MARNRGIEWDEKTGVLPNARRELPRLITAYFSHVREVLAEDGSPRRLHKLRLASKRLRYTLELFRPCYPAGLEERLDTLRKLQDSLGEVNDAVASAKLLRGALKRLPKVRKFLDDRATEQAEEFARYWKETFDAPGREAWWTDFLARRTARKVTVRSEPAQLPLLR
jgi:CHAD domain-containing protein